MQIKVFIDTSGSMNEMGKINLQRNLCRYLKQLPSIEPEIYSNMKIHVYQWTEEVKEIVLQGDGDIPVLEAKGSSILTTLSEFLSDSSINSKLARILVISDGNFTSNEISNFLKWKNQNNGFLIRVVAIGSDADIFKLKKVSTDNNVYHAENISSVINGVWLNLEEPIKPPGFINQIVFKKSKDKEEDDWDA